MNPLIDGRGYGMEFLKRFMNGMSIRNFLTGSVGVLALSLAVFSLNNIVTTRRAAGDISRMAKSNELADDILEAAGYEGKEGANTALALSGDGEADAATVGHIRELRASGDEAAKKGYELAGKIVSLDGSNEKLGAALTRAGNAYRDLEAARKKADDNFGRAAKDYSATDWNMLMGSYIDANADLRMKTFTSSRSRESSAEALRMNLVIKQAVYDTMEYAGRERAILARVIASGKPIDREAQARLDTDRAIVEMNLNTILALKDSDVDPDVRKAISKMEEIFLGRFQEVRKSVYEAGQTGSYPISGKEWVEKATEGIDSILDVSAAVGKMVDSRIVPDLRASKRSMILSVAGLALIILLGVASLFVINGKVISPMLFLNDRMAAIEKSGDLTVKIDVTSRDESGQMAAAFNRMMEKFHGVVREIHSSVDYLASSSEELSASATQIAGGSQAQASKAAQVSTAAQEMSATITEVARNVSSASEAAMEANRVAVSGGDIVARTIESMNGISRTASESSVIISNLGSRSHEIGNIINVIDDIADQTNLLALNAAIEAARAGEQGRGFAVVADEVRKLAEKTMKATKEIGEMISAMQTETGRAISSMESEVSAVNAGARLAGEAGDALKNIIDRVSVVTSMVHNITTALEEQSAATEQIGGDIESVSGVIAETSKSAQQIAVASNEIARLAAGLKQNVEIFRIQRAKKEMRVEMRAERAGEALFPVREALEPSF